MSDHRPASRRWRCRVPADADGVRLDVFLGEHVPELSRAQAQRLIREGRCTVNGAPARSGDRVAAGDDVVITIVEPPSRVAARPGALNVLFEDEWMLVLNKPAGVAVHPAPGTGPDTLLNTLCAYLGSSVRPSFVHRLDKDTSGAILAAKTVSVHRELKQQMDAGLVKRTYWAVVCGTPEPPAGTVNAPLAPAKGVRGRMAVDPEGRRAVTHFWTLATWESVHGPLALVQVRLETGRTHQIRVHLAHIGHPLLGDRAYGRQFSRGVPGLSGQALHSRSLDLVHPRTGAPLHIEAPVPDALAEILSGVSPMPR